MVPLSYNIVLLKNFDQRKQDLILYHFLFISIRFYNLLPWYIDFWHSDVVFNLKIVWPWDCQKLVECPTLPLGPTSDSLPSPSVNLPTAVMRTYPHNLIQVGVN